MPSRLLSSTLSSKPLLDPQKLPAHVAIIMDGNGRWARQRKLPRIFGHRAGIKSVRTVVEAAAELGVKYLTLYAFSAENWSRPANEVDALMRLLEAYLRKEVSKLNRNNIRLRTIGRRSQLPERCQKALEKTCSATAKNTGLTLVLALNYGGRQEILDSINRLLEKGVKCVTEEMLKTELDTSAFPDPDLIVRTSGEMRISNFLLWQSAYSEFHSTEVLWPDFRKEHFIGALKIYQQRHRRFGAVS